MMSLEQIIAGALFDFLGYLTSRPEEITLSAHHEPGPVIDALKGWAAERNLNLDEANVTDWNRPLYSTAVQEVRSLETPVIVNTDYYEGER